MKQLPGVILLIPSSREFDRGLRRGIVEYAHLHGPWIFYEEAPPYLQGISRRQRLRNLGQWGAQGVFVHQSRIDEVKSLRIPVVVVVESGVPGRDRSQIICANDQIGEMGAKTLLGLGLRHFAYCGMEGLEFSETRSAGFVKTVQEAGYTTQVYSSASRNPGQSWYAEHRQLLQWLSSVPKPTGLMACNDDRARMIAEICRLDEIRVPDDVAILGVDNDEQVCRSANPPLSSIALATERGGYEAAELLASMMAGRKSTEKVVTVHPLHAVPRQSTNVLAIEDPAMVTALRFVRENNHRNVRVVDISTKVGLSRRALQDRFKKYLGRTPMEEIHRCRVDRIAYLLATTNMTVGEIATACGSEGDAHVARFFSRQIGMTPLAYRKQNRIS